MGVDTGDIATENTKTTKVRTESGRRADRFSCLLVFFVASAFWIHSFVRFIAPVMNVTHLPSSPIISDVATIISSGSSFRRIRRKCGWISTIPFFQSIAESHGFSTCARASDICRARKTASPTSGSTRLTINPLHATSGSIGDDRGLKREGNEAQHLIDQALGLYIYCL